MITIGNVGEKGRIKGNVFNCANVIPVGLADQDSWSISPTRAQLFRLDELREDIGALD